MKVGCIGFLLLVEMLTLASWAKERNGKVTAADAMDMARTSFGRGDYRETIDVMRRVLAAYEQNDVVIDAADAYTLVGAAYHNLGEMTNAVEAYRLGLEHAAGNSGVSTIFLASNLARVQWDLGERDTAMLIIEDALSREPCAAFLNTKGLFLHYLGRDQEAVTIFEDALALKDDVYEMEILFNLGATLGALGRPVEAGNMYGKVLGRNPRDVHARINLAALYHEHQMLKEAIAEYLKVIAISSKDNFPEVERMARGNLGLAYHELGDGNNAILTLEELLSSDLLSEKDYISTTVNLHIARRAICDWKDDERNLHYILRAAESQLEAGNQSSLLPFDTLTRRLSPDLRLRIAKKNAETATPFPSKKYFPYENRASRSSVASFLASKESQIRVGYMSYDYNSHPTAHLAEGLFAYHNRTRVCALALSYGKDDGSTYRKRIENGAHEFVEFASASYSESVDLIHALDVHIIMDMQGFTRGGRPGICASRPAPIIINYLVFPGTSGAPFTDYFIGDKYVSPPENAFHFTERLIYHPSSYQVNYFDVHILQPDASSLQLPEFVERPAELPPKISGMFVFCNFNKSDKLDPTTFRVWMNILRRTPGSVLWLLEPSRRNPKGAAQMKKRLQELANAFGIRSARLVFAPRVSKIEHLRRHHHADLFLDSFQYGAHSTATDALRAGLPMLTIAGENVATRVGVSLLQTMGDDAIADAFIVHSMREFEDTAVLIAQSPKIASGLRQRLKSRVAMAGAIPPVFHTKEYVRDLERGLKMAWEVWAAGSAPFHLVA